MTSCVATIAGADCYVSRSGYTGEDGFEISIPSEDANTIARILLGYDRVEPIGLGARDSLRLEAGLCLYGHDMNETTSPVEASLLFSISKSRRPEGNKDDANEHEQRVDVNNDPLHGVYERAYSKDTLEEVEQTCPRQQCN